MLVVPGLATTRLVKDVRILVENFLSVRIVQAMPRSAIACTRTPIHQIWSKFSTLAGSGERCNNFGQKYSKSQTQLKWRTRIRM